MTWLLSACGRDASPSSVMCKLPHYHQLYWLQSHSHTCADGHLEYCYTKWLPWRQTLILGFSPGTSTTILLWMGKGHIFSAVSVTNCKFSFSNICVYEMYFFFHSSLLIQLLSTAAMLAADPYRPTSLPCHLQ